jgi:copper(I)-binding protein
MKQKILALVLALSCGALYAQTIKVTDAWVRATVPDQRATGAFMKIYARDGATLMGAASPVAGITQIHQMTLDGDVMKMRALADGLKIPAGKTVELKSGGYHLMLLDLKLALVKDSTVPLTLVFKDKQGRSNNLAMTVPVRLH